MSGKSKTKASGPIPIIQIVGEIDQEKERLFHKACDQLESMKHEYAIVRLSSSGGSVGAAFSIYDRMRMTPTKFIIHCTGEVMSAALIILCGGSYNVSSQNCEFMAHGCQVSSIKGDLQEITKEVKRLHSTNKRMFAIFESRCTYFGPVWADVCSENDFIFTADEAMTFGLIDEVINGKTKIRDLCQASTKKIKAKELEVCPKVLRD